MKTITNITHLAFALCAFACFAFSPEADAACQEGCLTNNNTVLGDDALLNTTRPPVLVRFKATLPAARTLRSVSVRSKATAPAPTTRRLVLLRFLPTEAVLTTLRLVLMRSVTTPVAATRPRVLVRWWPIQLAATTRLTVGLRSKET